MYIIKTLVDFFFGVGLFINAMLFIPQALRLYRTKNAKELSKITFVGFCLMQFSAVMYGLMHQNMILVIGYALSLLTCSMVTVLIFKYTN